MQDAASPLEDETDQSTPLATLTAVTDPHHSDNQTFAVRLHRAELASFHPTPNRLH